MSRFPMFLTLLVAVLCVLAFYFGWFAVTTTQQNSDKTNIEFSVDKQKMREDTEKARQEAHELGRVTRDEAHELANKLNKVTERNGVRFDLDSHSLQIEPGHSESVKIHRFGELTPLQLELTPSTGSNLTASGGEFKAGEDTATITVSAPQDAHDGSIRIFADGAAETLTVTIKQPPVTF